MYYLSQRLRAALSIYLVRSIHTHYIAYLCPWLVRNLGDNGTSTRPIHKPPHLVIMSLAHGYSVQPLPTAERVFILFMASLA
jgi:hypothetical protein